ncbi:UDP-N-acetylglucosamine 2-epimerase (non-hydrolyzing) [Flavobacteriaceae bacterium]|nr:UDP-N-acetylglucosamine 2-epimerase (non-hydrolyzing) [Flavobacteriaceae bacterium]MDC3297673.1 UDP-N-acetylglucosamine 2-epimerase (non-hydrolyzing) [Flavobacteriaceae bacterium]
MTPLNIITVVGTRPEIIRLSRIISALDKSKSINHILIHTGQNYDYELNEIFFKDLEIRKPDYFLEASGKNASETIGNIFIKIDPIFEKLKPDALLILGDTNSCLCSISAKKRKIPIFHIEAGNRCYDQRVPEETNRKIVDHIADINLTYSDISREYLIREGLPGDRIIKLGSPMFEVLNFYNSKILKSTILNKLSLKKDKYFLVSTHREENISEPYKFKSLIESLNQLAINYKMPIVVSTHPRTRNKLNEQSIKTNSLIQFIDPLGFTDYNNLQINAFLVLSDSGTISEESSILNFRALNIRESHERPEAMEEASVMMVGLDFDNILRGVEEVIMQDTSKKRNFHIVSDYSSPNVSSKVVRIILSYTSYINRVVWQKK